MGLAGGKPRPSASSAITSPADGVAIIGMAGRFPGARNVDELWRNLRDGKEGITFFSDEELMAAGVEASLLRNPKYVKAGGVLEDIAFFDAEFFGYSPGEAELIDPQHRIFLECAWQALENAGYCAGRCERPIGVFAGAGISTYLEYLYSNPQLIARADSNQITFGNEKQYLTSRVAYRLNLRGPAVTVQTACSTSLVAVHLAAQSLSTYECDMALAGGVLVCARNTGYLYVEGGILSPDGHNRSFDEAARGTVGGNGCGIVVLKRLEDALRDGDRIRAVIKGSAINNDGAMKAGFTAPAVDGQAEVIVRSQSLAGIGADSISYLETHGSATPLGDPVEISASTKAFQCTTNRKQFCAIGSVKSNLGHLGEAAGIAGLIKAVLALEHKMLPPSLHFSRPNPNIRFEESPFFVNTSLTKWERNGAPLRAGVSSFGIGGTNAHVILEEAPDSVASAVEALPQLIVLSARTETALKAAAGNLAQHFKGTPDINLADAAFTLQSGRQEFSHRRFAVCRNVEDAILRLEDSGSSRAVVSRVSTETRNPVFIFPGAVRLDAGVLRRIHRDVPFFASALDECFQRITAILGTVSGNAIGTEVRGFLDSDDERADFELLARPSLLHPVLFSLEHSLARLCMQWGIAPQIMLGYGVGEYVAACLAGVFSLEDALTLVTGQAQVIESLPEDDLLAVALSENEIQSLPADHVSTAVIYANNQGVLAGSPDAILRIEKVLKQKASVFRLTNRLFFCRRAKLVRERMEKLLQGIKLHPPRMLYISSVTGKCIEAKDAVNRQYWSELLGATVRFSDSLKSLEEVGPAPWLEVGPADVLAELTRRKPGGNQESRSVAISMLLGGSSGETEVEHLLTAVGGMWSAGTQIGWASLQNPGAQRRIPLPSYPFDRRRYWAKENGSGAGGQTSADRLPIAEWFYAPSWKRTLAGSTVSVAGTLTSGKWLIFADDQGWGTRLKERLDAEGHQVITVHKGDSFRELSDCSYAIRPDEPDHYERLISMVLERHSGLERIVHLWGVSGPQPLLRTDFDDSQACGFYSLLYLAAALKGLLGQGIVEVKIVADGLFGVTGAEPISPEKSTMLGPGMVAQQEISNLSFRYIDVASAPDHASYGSAVGPLLSELTSASSDFMVALRGKHRWIRSFERMHLSDDAPTAESWLRPGGVYLLTGGMGKVGLLVADYLAKTLKARLVLVGRSEIPSSDLWHRLPKNCDPQTAQIVAKLRAMQEHGAEIMVARADISSLHEMESVLERAQRQFGSIHGIFHLAGVALTKPVEETTASDAVNVFHGKVHGVYILEKLVQRYQPEFCVLFSSNASVLGGLGFSAYSAANCFLDCYAARANSGGGVTHWISVNWDGWMLPEQRGDERLSTSTMARYVMLPEESVEALRRILVSAREDRVVVSRENLHQRIDTWVKRERNQGKVRKEQSLLQRYPRPQLHNEYVCPGSKTEEAIVEILQDLLRIETIGVRDDFFDLGGDSLMAIDLLARINLQFEVDLPMRTILDALTAAQLGEIVDAMRKEMISVLEEFERLE
jgi:acyl transferase domain-containing protein/acyl carrier protein